MALPSDAPFFLMANYYDPHEPWESQVNGLPEEPLRAGQIKPPAFVRRSIPDAAKRGGLHGYYNCVSRLDTGVGLLMEALAKSGRADNTLVIFVSDNGAPFPGGKGTCYEAGLQAPFFVRWPGRAKFADVQKRLMGELRGWCEQTNDRLVDPAAIGIQPETAK